MPTIVVQVFEGRTNEQKRKLGTLTQSVVEALDVRREGVRVPGAGCGGPAGPKAVPDRLLKVDHGADRQRWSGA